MRWDELVGPPGVSSLVIPVYSESTKQWLSWLSEQERDRLKSYTVLKRRHEFVAGRVAARQLLARELKCDPADVHLRVTDFGAVLVEQQPCHLSIAHSGKWAVAVCAETRVGVDLEEIVEREQKLERFLFHPEERSSLDSELTPDLFTKAWVIKEAVLKARQTGLKMMASRLRIHGDLTASTPLHVEEPDGTRWRVWQRIFDGYPWAIALPA